VSHWDKRLLAFDLRVGRMTLIAMSGLDGWSSPARVQNPAYSPPSVFYFLQLKICYNLP